jgi:hypothetical protein
MRPRIAFDLKWAIPEQRRADACALPKSRDCRTKQKPVRSVDFARRTDSSDFWAAFSEKTGGRLSPEDKNLQKL